MKRYMSDEEHSNGACGLTVYATMQERARLAGRQTTLWIIACISQDAPVLPRKPE